jgi:hypothetical protein
MIASKEWTQKLNKYFGVSLFLSVWCFSENDLFSKELREIQVYTKSNRTTQAGLEMGFGTTRRPTGEYHGQGALVGGLSERRLYFVPGLVTFLVEKWS